MSRDLYKYLFATSELLEPLLDHPCIFNDQLPSLKYSQQCDKSQAETNFIIEFQMFLRIISFLRRFAEKRNLPTAQGLPGRDRDQQHHLLHPAEEPHHSSGGPLLLQHLRR